MSLAGIDAAVDDYMSTKLIYFCGSQSDQPSIAVINRRFVYESLYASLC